MEQVAERLESIAPIARPGTPLGDLAAHLGAGGHGAHLVGGSVRDALLGAPPVDLDVATDARPERVQELTQRLELRAPRLAAHSTEKVR